MLTDPDLLSRLRTLAYDSTSDPLVTDRDRVLGLRALVDELDANELDHLQQQRDNLERQRRELDEYRGKLLDQLGKVRVADEPGWITETIEADFTYVRHPLEHREPPAWSRELEQQLIDTMRAAGWALWDTRGRDSGESSRPSFDAFAVERTQLDEARELAEHAAAEWVEVGKPTLQAGPPPVMRIPLPAGYGVSLTEALLEGLPTAGNVLRMHDR